MFENEFHHIISRDSRDSCWCIELRIAIRWEKLSWFRRILFGKMRFFELISTTMSFFLSSVPDNNPARFLQHRAGVWHTRPAQLRNVSARILRDMNFCYPPVLQTGPEARPTSCTVDDGTLSRRKCDWGMGLTTHPHLTTRLKKGQRYTSTHPLLCFHSVLEDEVYFNSLLELLALFHKTPTKPSKIRYMEYFASLGLYETYSESKYRFAVKNIE